jgi:hypothetical protein
VLGYQPPDVSSGHPGSPSCNGACTAASTDTINGTTTEPSLSNADGSGGSTPDGRGFAEQPDVSRRGDQSRRSSKARW